jgi:hypothetical protein
MVGGSKIMVAGSGAVGADSCRREAGGADNS